MPGRNPLLLLKPLLWCGERGIEQLALATLGNNPFTDATGSFLRAFEAALEVATGHRVNVVQPFADQEKQDVLKLAERDLLGGTFSCLAPQDGKHCGVCNKCAERQQALNRLPGGDPTCYLQRFAVAHSID